MRILQFPLKTLGPLRHLTPPVEEEQAQQRRRNTNQIEYRAGPNSLAKVGCHVDLFWAFRDLYQVLCTIEFPLFYSANGEAIKMLSVSSGHAADCLSTAKSISMPAKNIPRRPSALSPLSPLSPLSSPPHGKASSPPDAVGFSIRRRKVSVASYLGLVRVWGYGGLPSRHEMVVGLRSPTRLNPGHSPLTRVRCGAGWWWL